ncbi:MAG: hypothetical protein ACYC1C_19630 [Chloroflexota bacterium]
MQPVAGIGGNGRYREDLAGDFAVVRKVGQVENDFTGFAGCGLLAAVHRKLNLHGSQAVMLAGEGLADLTAQGRPFCRYLRPVLLDLEIRKGGPVDYR